MGNRSRGRGRNNHHRQEPPPGARDVLGVDRDKPFAFSHKGRTYTLPPASVAKENISLGEVMDMVESGDEMAQLRMGLGTLRNSGASTEAINALREKKLMDGAKIIYEWMRRTSGGSPGE